MKLISSPFHRHGVFSVLFCLAAVAVSGADVLTVQIGSSGAAPVPLVNHGDSWRWHKGTNAPVAGWQTITDASLGTQWGTGPGGFGYSDDTPNEVSQCQTILADMKGLTA